MTKAGWIYTGRRGKEGISGTGNSMDKGVEDPELDFSNNQSCRRKEPSSPRAGRGTWCQLEE